METQSDSQEKQSKKKLPGAWSLFGPSWQAFKLNFWVFFWGILIPFAVLVLPLVLVFAHRVTNEQTALENNTATASINVTSIILGALGIFLVAVIFLPYMYLLKLQSAKGVKVKMWPHFKQSLHYFWRLLGLIIVRDLIIFCGFILLIVPGFIFWRRYMLAPYYLVDEDGKVFESMTKSAAQSKPIPKTLRGLMWLYILFSVIGFIPLIGWLISTVLSIGYCCAQAIRYRQVKALY